MIKFNILIIITILFQKYEFWTLETISKFLNIVFVIETSYTCKWDDSKCVLHTT